jgi:NADPH2:quinone reductase
MKAILAVAPGRTEVLQLRDIPKPALPSSHHVLVKLAAASINPIDTKLRAKPLFFPDKLPAILGCDGAGVVEATGSAVTRFKAGDQVFFCSGGIGNEPGNYAEYTALHEEHCARKPAKMGLQDSAALPLVFITAWESLVDRVNLQAGQTVLIHAGAGGVGHVAIQLARHLGARVAVTVSDDSKAAMARNLGAEKTINYKKQDFVQETLSWTGGQGADVVYDTVGGETFLRSLPATRMYGKVVSILSTPLSLADSQLARLRNLSLCYDLMLAPQAMGLDEDRIRQRKILDQCAALVDAGKLAVHVSRRLPLEQVAEAHRLIETGGTIGKIILTID